MGCGVVPSVLLNECNLLFLYSEIIAKAENEFEQTKITQG